MGFLNAPVTVPEVGFIVLASAVGACALIEILKRVFKIRARYHRDSLRDWLRNQAKDTSIGRTSSGSDDSGDLAWRIAHDEAFLDFEKLIGLPESPSRRSSQRARWAFYNAPLEQLSAQIATSFERAIVEWYSFPTLVERLFPGFVALVEPLEVDRLSRLKEKSGDPDDNSWGLAEHSHPLRQIERMASDQAQREVDLFQIVIGSEWRRSVSTWALLFAAMLGFTLAALLLDGGILASTFTAAILGGFLAWVVRDLSAGIERWRGGA